MTTIYKDHELTAIEQRDKGRKLASAGHLTLTIHQPFSSIYALSSQNIPLLTKLKSLAHQLLHDHRFQQHTDLPASHSTQSLTSPFQQDQPPVFPPQSPSSGRLQETIGFVVSPFKDPLNPTSPQLTLHAFLGPLDLASFYVRSFPFGPLGFYALDDLIAEIRESTSNNRIKSGAAYQTPRTPTTALAATAGAGAGAEGSVLGSPASSTGWGSGSNRDSAQRPLERVPEAGAREGFSNGLEIAKEGRQQQIQEPVREGIV